jgi:hypothetical protein
MTIPNTVLCTFIKEVENTKYGKVSLGIIRRGNHIHYEIDKHMTMTNDDEVVASGQDEKTADK